MRSRFLPVGVSILLHAAAIAGVVGIGLGYKPPVFAMNAGRSNVTITLLAADPTTAPSSNRLQKPIASKPTQPDAVAVLMTQPLPPAPVEPPKQFTPPAPTISKHRATTVAKGDGSAPKPGRDATTAAADNGAIIDTTPEYLNNPAPIYPELSRAQNQQGVVLLEVVINERGRPESISVQSSSGYPLLDQSAVSAVHQWRFRPASLGEIKMKSRVVIPVNFQLTN